MENKDACNMEEAKRLKPQLKELSKQLAITVDPEATNDQKQQASSQAFTLHQNVRIKWLRIPEHHRVTSCYHALTKQDMAYLNTPQFSDVLQLAQISKQKKRKTTKQELFQPFLQPPPVEKSLPRSSNNSVGGGIITFSALNRKKKEEEKEEEMVREMIQEIDEIKNDQQERVIRVIAPRAYPNLSPQRASSKQYPSLPPPRKQYPSLPPPSLSPPPPPSLSPPPPRRIFLQPFSPLPRQETPQCCQHLIKENKMLRHLLEQVAYEQQQDVDKSGLPLLLSQQLRTIQHYKQRIKMLENALLRSRTR